MTKMYSLLMIIAMLVGMSGLAHDDGPRDLRTVDAERLPVRFEEVLNALGGYAALATGIKSRVSSIELTMTDSPEGHFERRVITAIDGARLRRETVDPHCIRSRVETINDQGKYYGRIVSREYGGRVSTELPAESERVRTVTWLVETTGLLSLLREFARSSTRAYWVGRTVDDLDEFQVVTPKGECTVYSDRARFIRSIKTGNVVLQFSHYQSIGGLELPYVERVLLHGRLVREIYFSSIDLSPTFEADYFKGSSVSAERCR